MSKQKSRKYYPISNPPKHVKRENAEIGEIRYKKNQATINYKGFTLNLDLPEIINAFKGKE